MRRSQGFDGYAWICDGCSKRFKTATLIVLDQQIDEHLRVCVKNLRKRSAEAMATEVQGDLFEAKR